MHLRSAEEAKLEKTSHEEDMRMLTKQVLFDWKKRNTKIQGRLSMVNYAVLAPNGYFTQHKHISETDPGLGMTESFFIISGNASFKINGKEQLVSDKTLIIVDKGETHSMKNLSKTKPVIYIVFGISTGGETIAVRNEY